MQRRLIAIVGAVGLVGGCGRIGYDAVSDAGTGDDAVDATTDAAACVGECVACAPRGFTDDFDDGVRGDAWGAHADTSSSATEVGGELVITAAIEDEAFYESNLRYDLRTQPIVVRLAAVELAPPSSDACLAVRDDDYVFAGICIEDGGTTLEFHAPGAAPQTMPYVAASMAWWRLRREATGAGYAFSTSADGVTWAPDVVIMAGTPQANPAWVRLAVSNYSGPSTVATYRFDDARVGANPDNGSGQAAGCPPAGWHDDFADDQPAPRWITHADPGGVASETAGAAVVAPPLPAAESGHGYFETVQLYDLRASSVTVTLAATLAGGDAECGLDLLDYAGANGVGFSVLPPLLYTSTTVDYSRAGRTNHPYDPVAMRHLRLRHAGSTLTWETSPDGAAWTVRDSATGLFDPHAAMLDLFSEKNGGAATGDCRFDDLTLGP